MHDPTSSTLADLSGSDAGRVDPLRDIVADALRYWEPRRMVYNAALTLVVIAVFGARWSDLQQHASADLFLGLFLLAVLANVAYCSAYLVDVFVQRSGLAEARRRVRAAVFAVGMLFASVLAQFVARGMVSGG